MKNTLIILLLFLSLEGAGNVMIYPTTSFAPPHDTNIMTYYSNIYKAEKFVILGNADSALDYYFSAIKVNNMFWTDVANFNKCFFSASNEDLKVAILTDAYLKSNDTVTSDGFVTRVASFLTDQGKEKLQKTIEGREKVPAPDATIYKKISAILEPLDAKDQQYRTPCNDGNSGKLIKKRKKLDRENFKNLMKCYSRYGSFPTVKITPDAYLAFRMVLLHNFFDKKKQKKYDDFFIKEVRNGNLDARDYAKIVDNYRYDSTQLYGDHTMFSVGDSLFVFKLTETGKQKIDANRKLIFLQDIETTQQSLIWQWKNDSQYIFGIVWEFEPYENETASSMAKSQLIKLGPLACDYSVYTR